MGEAQPCYTIGDTLVTFRFAGIFTAEANNDFADGTVAGGLAWMNALVNQINLLLVRELSFRLELLADSDSLLYTNGVSFTHLRAHHTLPHLLRRHLLDKHSSSPIDDHTSTASFPWFVYLFLHSHLACLPIPSVFS